MALTPAAQKKFAKTLEEFNYSEVDSAGFVAVYVHKDDQRHIVVDSRQSKVVKRFRNGESSWSDAARFARDYANKHEFDEDYED